MADKSYSDYGQDVKNNAKNVLDWTEKNGWGTCGTPVGKIRANQLAKGEPISVETIKRMYSYLSRHEVDLESSKSYSDGCGKLMYDSWGGKSALSWSRNKLKELGEIDENFIVKKEQGETKDEFIGRCIGIEINNGYEQDQAAAMCIAKADEEFTILDEFKKWRSKPTSANVKDIMYNDEIEELVIKFHDGQIYTYPNISFSVFQDIYSGNAKPITSGENRWHKWEQGKAPSVGAAVYRMLVRRNVPFTRGGNLR